MMKKRQNEQPDVLDEVINGLMNTIRIPKKLHGLQQKLPKPNYNPLKMRPRQNSISAMSFDNVNKIQHQLLSHNSLQQIASLPKIKRKLMDIADHPKKLQIDDSNRKRRRRESLEHILQQRNDRIRLIYGQARKKRSQHDMHDSMQKQHSHAKVNLPSIGKHI